MDIEIVREHCLFKHGVVESLPFDDETLVFKVCDKIFAVIALEKPNCVTLKCHPSLTEELRAKYCSVTPAAYFNKNSWNTVFFNDDVPDDLIMFLIDHAYGETLRCLPKKRQILFFKESISPTINYRHLNVCDSTMEECCSDKSRQDISHLNIVTTDFQRKGRGQRGNHWESENGKNLLFSFSFHPEGITAGKEFRLSQAVSLSLLEAIRTHCPPHSPDLAKRFTIKWPNDIYFDNYKVGGMLLEHTLEGRNIQQTVVGIGLNINQDIFRSEAPNPISLKNILGYELPRFLFLKTLIRQLTLRISQISAFDTLHQEYISNLYRNNGFHLFNDGVETFEAEINEILPDGRIVLRREDNTCGTYGFKQLTFVINHDVPK